jgi:hypothetical protein
VANSEGESPDFGELEPLGDELEPLGEEGGESSASEFDAEEFVPPDFESLLTPETVSPDAPDPSALDAVPTAEIAAEDAVVTVEGAAGEEADEELAVEAAPEKPATLSEQIKANLDWAIAGGIAVFLLLLALVGLFSYWTAIYVVAVGLAVYAMWKMRETNDLYTVILGCALIAILTAVYCMWLELGRYQFDVKAREAKQHASASWLPGPRSLG